MPSFSFFTQKSFLQTGAGLAACLILCADAARAADWPQWRGPGRDGISPETGWTAAWPASGPKVLWKAHFGAGCSSFAVVGNRVFTMGNAKDEGSVFCLDARTGEPVWRYAFPSVLDPKMFDGGQCSTPTVDGDRVYALGRQGQLFCLDKATGAVVWSKDLPRDFGAKVASWGYAGSPLVLGGMLIVDVGAKGASAVAFDKATGAVLWQAGDDPQAYSSPYAFQQDGKQRVAFFNGFGLVVREAADGKEVLRFPWKTDWGINAVTPIVSEGKLLISSGYNHGAALLPLDAPEPKPVWENKSLRNRMNSSVLWRGCLYGFDEGTLTCLDFATGEVKWRQEGLGLGALILANGKLLIQAESGAVVVAEAAPEAYKELARVEGALPKKSWVAPVLADGKLFCRNNGGEAVVFDLSAPNP
ncbi:MAG: PQQ-binding-like beta-propeller repeat protein [Chthoniobacteraceae bacterium]|nr:PQQ-binding-like beta-propeller repeat protein [Chthoniobacteraceae bacterium]